MKSIEILSKISERQIATLMLHEQLADYYDFLGLHGYKRMHEYYHLKENAQMRSIRRYAINHLDRLINNVHPSNPSLIPATWFEVTRFDVNNDTRKKAAMDGMMRWHRWQSESKKLYCDCFNELMHEDVSTADKINWLIKDTERDLKRLERKVIELNAVGGDLMYILMDQKKVHHNYKYKMKKEFKICF